MSDSDLTLAAHLPPTLAAAVQDLAGRAAEEDVAGRLREGDPSLWGGPETPEVADRLGWLTIAQRMHDDLPELQELVGGVLAERFTDVVLLGMGGSSLAPEVLRRAFAGAPDHPRLHVLDSTDAQDILSVQDAVAELSSALFVVSSKSGSTIEPLSLYSHFHSLVPDGSHYIAITDPGSGLAALAAEQGFRHTFFGDPDIGGRYSALSPFGIVPAALAGIDVAGLLRGAPAAWETALAGQELPGPVWLGVALAALARSGRDKLTFLLAESLPGLGLWLEQLVAESTGKQGTGILPVAEEPLGAPDVYGEDRVFAYLPDLGAPDPDMDARVTALAEAGHPVIVMPTRGPGDLGRVFLLAELAVAVAGWGLDINPFDQPDVQRAKDATNRVLDGYKQNGELPTVADATPDELRELVLDAGPPAYVALMAYTRPDPALDAAVAELREAIRAGAGATTTFGYGPRFLHSTGQFHKGGPRTGRFLQLLHDGPRDVAIPGQTYSFTTLKEAQAIGDLQTLRELGLPAQRLRLDARDPVGALRALTATIRERT